MNFISYVTLSGDEISDDVIRQYLEINSNVYPEFTLNRFNFQRMRSILNDDKHIKVVTAMKDSELIGWLMVSYAEKLKIHHFNMLVHEDFHKMGIGSKLLDKAKESFDDLYGVLVPVDTYKTNNGKRYKSPLKFYLKNGFELTGRKFVEYGDVELLEIRWSAKGFHKREEK